MLNRVPPGRSGVDQAGAPDWIGRARALAPLISAAADRIEQEREIPEEVVCCPARGTAVPHAAAALVRRRRGRARDLRAGDRGDRQGGRERRLVSRPGQRRHGCAAPTSSRKRRTRSSAIRARPWRRARTSAPRSRSRAATASPARGRSRAAASTRSGSPATAWSRNRTARRACIPTASRSNARCSSRRRRRTLQGHLARHGPEGHGQRPVHGHRPVRAGRPFVHARMACRIGARTGRSTGSPTISCSASASRAWRSGSRVRLSMPSSRWRARRRRATRRRSCATMR